MTIDPRGGALKRTAGTAETPIHPGMSKRSKSGPLALGGDHSSAIDAATGRETIPGEYGPGLVDGPALDRAPVAKPDAPPLRPVIGHRSRSNEIAPGEVGEHVNNPARQFVPNDIGRAVLDEAGVHAAKFDDFNARMAAANKPQ